MPNQSPDSQESWRIFRIMAEFVEGFEVMAGVGNAVSIFGSARTKPDDKYYIECERTAKLLAEAGYAVITGGGPGIMEAGNKGAFEVKGGRSVGLNISLPHEQDSNRYQTVSLDFHYFYARKVMFTKYADAFVCFPGGFGTMDEFFETLTLVQTTKIDSFPIILYGSKFWTGLVDWMKETLAPNFIDGEDTNIFKICDSPEEVVKLVQTRWWKQQGVDVAADQPGANTPLSGYRSDDTGEGTRYGKRPRISTKAHITEQKKPTQ